MVKNTSLIFASVPKGLPVPGKDLILSTTDFNLSQSPPTGGVITKNLYASFDPYMRGRMRPPNTKSYSPPYELNKPIPSWTVAKVQKSNTKKFVEGDLVVAAVIPIQEYSALSEEAVEKLKKVENPYHLDLKLFIGALGMPGLTAYSSLYEIGKPVRGETIFISAASGAVGQIVGQLAKHEGLKVIGSVGSDDKLDFILNELNFDGGFNYKKEKPLDALTHLAPDGVDIYYENVGGEQLEAAIESMNDFGRIIACGMVSQYSRPDNEKYGVKNLMLIVGKRITFRGFIVGDKNMGPVYFEERNKNLGKWINDGTFKVQMSVTDGIDNAPEGFVGMLEGKNFGKAVLKIAQS